MHEPDRHSMSRTDREQESDRDWNDLVSEVIEEDRELLDALAD